MSDDVFPQIKDSDGMHCRPSGGLTKRELFAAMCLQSLITNIDYHNVKTAAEDAVKYDDALLAKLGEK